MSLTLSLHGVKLTQEQVDACVPELNKHLAGEYSMEKYILQCERAMRKAKCPLVIPNDLNEDRRYKEVQERKE